jgi:hypothetical protein
MLMKILAALDCGAAARPVIETARGLGELLDLPVAAIHIVEADDGVTGLESSRNAAYAASVGDGHCCIGGGSSRAVRVAG